MGNKIRLINFLVTEDVYQKFKKMAEEEGINRAFILRRLLEKWFLEKEKAVK